MADGNVSQVDPECSLHVREEASSLNKNLDISNTRNASVMYVDDGDNSVCGGGAATPSTVPAVAPAGAADTAAVDDDNGCGDGGAAAAASAAAVTAAAATASAAYVAAPDKSAATALVDDASAGGGGDDDGGSSSSGVNAAVVDASDGSGCSGRRLDGSYRDASKTILWCSPRSGSTALTKCLSAIEGNQVWFEPFFYCHVAARTTRGKLDLQLPPTYEGNEEVYRQAAGLIDELYRCKSNPEFLSYTTIKRLLEESVSRHVFAKEMIPALCDKDQLKFIPDGYAHAFLIRHPLRVFASLRKLLLSHLAMMGVPADENTLDIGHENPFADRPGEIFKDIFNIWKHVRETSNTGPPIVIDSDDLLTKPAEVLPKFCEAVGLPFDDTLLKWDPSTKVTRKWMFFSEELIEKFTHAYGRAITSSEFIPPGDLPAHGQVTPDVIRCADEAMEYYNEMYAAILKP